MVKELGLASVRGRYYPLLIIQVFSVPSQMDLALQLLLLIF
uniref:Uncharacterized protein n=1 Tax=Arundo donax TaxID=35708 RepID=A0A0A9GW43_ARUDO